MDNSKSSFGTNLLIPYVLGVAQCHNDHTLQAVIFHCSLAWQCHDFQLKEYKDLYDQRHTENRLRKKSKFLDLSKHLTYNRHIANCISHALVFRTLQRRHIQATAMAMTTTQNDDAPMMIAVTVVLRPPGDDKIQYFVVSSFDDS